MGDARGPVTFHELPLVLFSALATAGAGVGAVHLLSGFLGNGWAFSPARALVVTCLLLVAGVISGFHLGRPLRGPLALRGSGRSPLSNEILALAAAVVFAGSGLILPDGPWMPFLGVLAALFSLFFLLALGKVYVLPGQVAWRGLAATAPLVMGLTWGLILDVGLSGGIPGSFGRVLVWAGLILDGAISLGRWRSLEVWAGESQVVHPALFRRRRLLLGARIALASLATPGALLWAGWDAAAAVFLGAVLLDRFGFYALALRQTTEAEVRRVEALLQG